MTSQPPDPSPCLFNDPSVFVKTEYDQGKMTFGCMSVVNKPGLRAPGSIGQSCKQITANKPDCKNERARIKKLRSKNLAD